MNDELISLKEASRRLPSHRPGKRVHLATIYRWILSGRLPAVKRGRWYFVRPEDLGALNTPVETRAPLPIRTNRQERASINAAREQLRKAGYRV